MKKMSVKSVKRDASTSTLGHDEARKPLMAAYMFQRRVLLGCSVLMALSLIIWIIAIATDRWIIITGGGGIFIPETRRFFMASHSGLWRHCRETKTPNALPNSTVIRNFTSFAFTNVGLVNNAKMNMSHMEFIEDFRYENVTFPLKNFTQEAKKRMFAHWIRNDEPEFQTLKAAFQSLELSSEKSRKALNPSNAKAIAINPLDIQNAKERNTFGNALQEVVVNSTNYNFIIPEAGQAAIFENWNKIDQVLNLLWAYFRDLGIPPYVLNENGVVLQLVPPIPPKKQRLAYGYDYVPSTRCKYIDMFSNAKALRNEPAYDDTLLDYIRTQASFACITVFVMSLGSVFSFYTFMNPRYMFKRLAGGIHLVSASTALVVIQVLFASIDYTKEHLFYSYPDGAELTYGFGVYLAWFTFAVNIVCGIMFIWYSGKKKGSKAPTDEIAMADEPTIMGR